MMEKEKVLIGEKDSANKCNSGYTSSEDMAILNYMITDTRYLNSSGIQVWKDAEKLGICHGRSHLSMKERFRKVIAKNLKQYNVKREDAKKITQFLRANRRGKHLICYKEAIN